MKIEVSNTKIACMLLALLPCLGCTKMGERIKDESVGLNGGFEHVQSGLPVNWLVYSPATIPTGDYELAVDREDFKEGTQSLQFHVRECSADGGWHSPGIARELPATPGETYRLRFWIKNEGCDYVVGLGGVDAKTGDVETVIDSSGETSSAWTLVDHEYTVTEPHDRLRFELSIRSPGTLWIDGLTVERRRNAGGVKSRLDS